MDQDQPSLIEILRVVREFIDDSKDALPEKDRYHALCCSYLLALAEREVAAGALPGARASEAATTDARRELAVRVRAGECDADWDRTFERVLHDVIEKVRISKPEHLDAMHRRGR